jgi:transcriptional regulator with XRE-family HTH domain
VSDNMLPYTNGCRFDCPAKSNFRHRISLTRQNVVYKVDFMPDRTVPFDPRQLIRESRIAAGLTQAQVAEKAAIPRSKLSLYESGFVDLTAEELRSVEKVLKDQLKGHYPNYPGYPSSSGGRLSRMLHGVDAPADAKESRSEVGTQPMRSEKQFLKTAVQQILEDGKLAAQWRKSAGMSQYEASRKAKISRTRLSAWENGDIQLSKEDAARCCQVYAEAEVKKSLRDPWYHLDVVTKERDELKVRNAELERRDRELGRKVTIAGKIDDCNERMIATYKEEIAEMEKESLEKDAKIADLEKQIADRDKRIAEFRAYYAAGSEAALAHARFEELGEKVSIPDVKGEE